MNEDQFARKIQRFLSRNLKTCEVTVGESLLYKLIIDTEGHLRPRDINKISRGQYAFQTDILIKNKQGGALVVIETKYGGFSTHDIITYSVKANRHKEIYPYLRYG